ncbi:MAG TPA: serine/threonine-protein kinase, partial [Planctomycetota bacterium]|nr:serine/threonine-protein kinase [Planctomycetota bacterium]
MEQGDATGNSQGIAIGHLALRRGLISPEQLREALMEQSKSGKLRSLDSILLDKGFVTREQLELLHAERETAAFPIPAPAPAAGSSLEPPAVLGRYRLLREAGRGAMARVFEAMDLELERKVALKLLHSSPNAQGDEAGVDEARFLREARLSAGLPKHPNIVGVYDAGVISGRRFLAMEFIDGVPMDKWLKAGSVSIGRPATLLRDVALAVDHAHGHGVIHRDLKPANILVDAANQPHVMDFGLAKIAGQSVKASYTEGGFAVGTPAYMSPEQVQGARSVDHRTDVYSLGVILYEILTGKLPFIGSTPMEIMQKATQDAVVPPSKITTVQINPVHFQTLEAICLKALCKDPRDRYPTARAFAADLSRWLRGQDFRIANWKLRRRALGALAAAAALGVLGAVWMKKPWLPSIESELARADALLAASKADQALVVYTQTLDRDRGNVRAEAGRKAAVEKLREKPVPLPAPAPPPDPWKLAVDVLPAISLDLDVVSGKWVREASALVSREGRPARVQVPYHPPEEYDLRIVFARQAANFCVNLILSRDGQAFTLVMHRDGVFGFERLRGQDFHQNATTGRFDTALTLNVAYTVTVEVRKEGVKAWCNHQPVSTLPSYEEISMNPDWKLPDSDALGLGTWDGGAAIHSLQIRE